MALSKVVWGDRKHLQIKNYREICNEQFKVIEVPTPLTKCANEMCKLTEHRADINKLYATIVEIMRKAAESSFIEKKYLAGWNNYVKAAHGRARLAYVNWVMYGKPSRGPVYQHMYNTKRKFQAKLRWCEKNQEVIILEIMASHHKMLNFYNFCKKTNIKKTKSFPLSIDGFVKATEIANLFMDQFKVDPPILPDREKEHEPNKSVRFVSNVTSKDVALVFKKIKKGESCGHDNLSIEHLKNAGVHLLRVLALFMNLCITHSYLPEDLMHTLVVPIIKHKCKNVSDRTNYTPKSLPTIMAKVMDGILDSFLRKHLKIHDLQFGSKPELPDESALLCLKYTVRYYTVRNTAINACFLNMPQAFDLVSHDLLWQKLTWETNLPMDAINLFKYWYGNQKNNVKWGGSLSDTYRLRCGLRQGGFTSPMLFNLYVNALIKNLSTTYAGCYIDKISFNNISYAENMVLLTPSISASQKLLNQCEKYAIAHGLKYDVTKSKLLVFKKLRKAIGNVPNVYLYGKELSRVKQMKFLGHWLTENLTDDMDIERARKALVQTSKMLASRFIHCDQNTKILLFKAYCQTFDMCTLWVRHGLGSINLLRMEYNNSFRALMGLPQNCNLSRKFAETNILNFKATLRKRVILLRRRLLAIHTNIRLVVIAVRLDGSTFDCPILHKWSRTLVNPRRRFQQ